MADVKNMIVFHFFPLPNRSYIIKEIKALLLSQEERFNKHMTIEHSIIQANYAQVLDLLNIK